MKFTTHATQSEPKALVDKSKIVEQVSRLQQEAMQKRQERDFETVEELEYQIDRLQKRYFSEK